MSGEPEFIVLLRLLIDAVAWVTRQVINLICVMPLLFALMLPWRMSTVVSGIFDRCDRSRVVRLGGWRHDLGFCSFPWFALSHFACALGDMATLFPLIACLAMPWQWAMLVRICTAKAAEAERNEGQARARAPARATSCAMRRPTPTFARAGVRR